MKTIPIWTWPICLVICGLTFQSCAAIAPMAESALQAIAPVLADALTSEIKRKFGPDAEPDPATAVCVRDDGNAVEDYPEEFGDRGWIHCWVDRVKVE